MTTLDHPAPTTTTAGPLDERLVDAATQTLELFGVFLGTRLGLYATLRATGGLTPDELAAGAGIHPRYAREWLEQQAVAGVVTVDDPDAPAAQRRFALPDEHAAVLLDPDDPTHVAPLAKLVIGIAGVLDEVADAYRTGAGVPYARYGADFRQGQGGINRPAFTTALVDEWLPAAGDVVDRLRAGGRLADVACGQGWSTVAVAAAFPEAEVVGVDTDVASIDEARAIAAERGSTARFEAADGTALADHGPFDVALVLEALHDLARPVEVLAAVRRALASGGSVVVADEAVAPRFTAPGDAIERLMYGWSITHCLPAAMAEQPSAAIGTVIRADEVRRIATEAGFTTVEELDVDGGFFRLYRLAG